MNDKRLLLEEYIIAVMLLVMTVINGANIVSRYLFKYSLAFSEELLVYIFVWASMLGASAAVKRGANLGLSILTDLIPAKGQKHVTAITTFAGVILFAVLVIMGVQMVQSEYNFGITTPTMGLPEWIFGLGIPIGAGFYIYRSIQVILRAYRGSL